MKRKQASVLVAVLWCVSLLSLVVVGILHSSSLSLRVGKNYADLVQAHYLALAGVERAKALLYHDAAERRRGGLNHSGALDDAPRLFQDVSLGRGTFRVFRQDPGSGKRGLTYGLSDEESRLNLNTASAEELARIPDLRPEAVASILDWRDSDDQVTPSGAEIEYYATLPEPYQPRNGPLQSPRELLLVRAVPHTLFLGEDANQNGLLDPEEDDGPLSYPPDNLDGILDPGWSRWLTVYSSVEEVSASGETRVNVQTADESALAAVPGITPEIAKAIVATRTERKLENLADLLEVRAPNPQSERQPARAFTPAPNASPAELVQAPPANPSPAPSAPASPGDNLTGPPLINEALLMEIADHVTVSEMPQHPGAINVNTASAEVLACLPGFDDELARTVVTYRQSAGYFANVAWLFEVPGLTREVFAQVAPRITARSETFRILSEGTITSSGARKRIEVIIHLSTGGMDILAYRENL